MDFGKLHNYLIQADLSTGLLWAHHKHILYAELCLYLKTNVMALMETNLS